MKLKSGKEVDVFFVPIMEKGCTRIEVPQEDVFVFYIDVSSVKSEDVEQYVEKIKTFFY